MTLVEARDALMKQYTDARQSPQPVMSVQSVEHEGVEALKILVNKKSPRFVPPESLPGAGYEGFRCVSYLGISQLISDSGVIAPPEP